MISDARGGHVSPGIYTEEKDVTYSVKSLGLTSLGLAGETLYGPAFENIEIESWGDFVDYFGGTSAEKYPGTGLPKYELPYVAKSYLEQSKRLNVVRVLGLSGYHAGPAWILTSEYSGQTMPLAVIRSLMSYELNPNICDPSDKDKPEPLIESVKVGEYQGRIYNAACAETGAYSADTTPWKFSIEATDYSGTTYVYNVSLDPSDSDYIYNMISNNPAKATTPIYIEALYENSFDINDPNSGYTVTTGEIESTMDFDDYTSPYRAAQTPWIVSDVTATFTGEEANTASMRKLFKFITISDGTAANTQVKISIQNIKPQDGTFDVVIRDFNDTDENPTILESFNRCNLVDGTDGYIAYKIGSADGMYIAKSKYVVVDMAEGEDLRNCVPAGFLGYPMPDYVKDVKVKANYNTVYDPTIKPRRQYFGITNSILDVDMLAYKGVSAYTGTYDDANPVYINNGFHMDSILGMYDADKIYVDGVNGYEFTAVSDKKVGSETLIPRLINSESYLSETIYKDVKARKFTVCFYGGFDGWDVNRQSRTNTDEYKSSRYGVAQDAVNGPFRRITSYEDTYVSLNLPSTAITSDYYAYLAGYRVFANPQDIDINVFATPGIDWKNNRLLVEEALDVIEDSEDGRGGDALYIINAPCDADSPSNSVVYDLEDTEIDSSYAATYYPWVVYHDTTNRKYIELPVTKDVVRNLAETDNTSYPWFAPAGMERGNVKCVKATHKTTLAEEDDLYEGRINPVKSFAQDGIKIWGNKTMYTKESPLNRVNVRRLMIRVKKLVTEAAKNLIFEQYDDTLEKQFRGLVEPILADVKSNRGITDYRVVTEVTPETRDQHILPCKIMIRPTTSLEYISISFVVYPHSVAFED